ncbi:MAG: SDR family NAD(P)-dependent oxidoreductase [Gammaproteobacteria bacterium]|nr:SDR family NAD(P)-dependent oxidoreductase [Gammaproteobacteria bacterium]
MTNTPVTVIVGIGPGIGLAIAERFASAGHRVVGLGRKPRKVAGSLAGLRERGLKVETKTADAGDFAKLRSAIAAVERDAGPIEVLVYNAHRASLAPPSVLKPEDALDDFRVNVAGALVAAQAVLPGMRQRGRGTILFTGGGLALDPTGWLDASSLAIGKAGLRSLAFTLNKELGPAGVYVGTVTIAGMIMPGTSLAPEKLAEVFWEMHQSPAADRPPERICG